MAGLREGTRDHPAVRPRRTERPRQSSPHHPGRRPHVREPKVLRPLRRQQPPHGRHAHVHLRLPRRGRHQPPPLWHQQRPHLLECRLPQLRLLQSHPYCPRIGSSSERSPQRPNFGAEWNRSSSQRPAAKPLASALAVRASWVPPIAATPSNSSKLPTKQAFAISMYPPCTATATLKPASENSSNAILVNSRSPRNAASPRRNIPLSSKPPVASQARSSSNFPASRENSPGLPTPPPARPSSPASRPPKPKPRSTAASGPCVPAISTSGSSTKSKPTISPTTPSLPSSSPKSSKEPSAPSA